MSAVSKALSLRSPASAVIEIVKWKVRKGSKVDPGSILMTYKFDGQNEIRKLKSQQIGSVLELLKSEGDKVQPSQQILKLVGCSHSIVIKDMCAECGKDLRPENEELSVEDTNTSNKMKPSVSMVHSVPELVVTDKHAEEIGKADVQRLRKSRKLVLLVDLDQTLIHTTTDNVPNNLKGVHHFQMSGVWYHTKYRPGTEKFLQTVSKYYELHIVTFGVRLYAHTIARLMDPEGKYFSHRILSRDELVDANTKKANLKSLFPCGEDMVAIIDDREDVWNYSSNVIAVLPYKFFKGTGDINSPNKQPKPAPSEKASNTDTPAKTGLDTPLYVDVNLPESNQDDDSDGGDSSTVANQNSSTNESTNPDKSGSGKRDAACMLPEDSEEPQEKKIRADVECKEECNDNLTKDSESLPKPSADETTKQEVNSENIPASSSTDEPETVDNTESVSPPSKDSGTSVESKEPVEVEWEDKDTYLERLTDILVDCHQEFYKRDCEPKSKSPGKRTKAKASLSQQTVASVLSANRKEVLEGCVLAFSGLFPQSISLYHSLAYSIATKLGAQVAVNVEDNVTHLVASRLGTKKVRQAASNPSCTIVHPDWLWLTWYNFQRENELQHILTKDNEVPEPKPGNSNLPLMCGNYDPSFGRKRKVPESVEVNEDEIRKAMIADIESEYEEGYDDDTIILQREDNSVEAEEPRRRFSDTLNPIMHFDNDELDAMGAEIEGELSSSEDSDEEACRDKELRKKVLSSDEHESDSGESLSNDYPKGWGPRNRRRRSSPHDSYDELHEEEYMRMQEAAENSPMEINSSDSEEDDAMAAALDNMLS
ncbi:hypothetical protein EB796_003147 [Bugula neritina]|uniref:RNA polymerase II subunit A C-terminal domain phosphatase n=1 Tax=Bugula neritina TaxID=10212 RepID=A0A7J7KIL8_BUGNE|nr:hypothetical protein EB796_003147 [Bugula neritina]